MKVDRYTKVVLSIIAAALVMLTFQNIFEAKIATAASGVVKVSICNANGNSCADVSPIERTIGGTTYPNGTALKTF